MVEREGRRLAVTHSFVSDVAFVLVDVTDSSKPQKVGEYVLTNTHVYDLGLTPDQRFVLLATDTGGQGEEKEAPNLRARSYFEDACTGERTFFDGPETLVPMWAGVVAVDVRNPKQPVMADYLALGGGHSIQIRELLERTFALVTTSSFALIQVGPDGKLSPVSSFLDCTRSVAGTVVPSACNYHDGALQRHPPEPRLLGQRQQLRHLRHRRPTPAQTHRHVERLGLAGRRQPHLLARDPAHGERLGGRETLHLHR
jgi:hypothetical protein